MKSRIFTQFLILSGILIVSSCEKFVETDVPKTDLTTNTVFLNDQTAIGAISNIYALMASSNFSSGTTQSISYLGAISADEMDVYSTNLLRKQFADNQILPNNTELNTGLWTAPYQYIYRANAILEALPNSTITAALKKQLEGEAKFIRAFSNFYLVNLFGDIPLVLTTDYRINGNIPRTLQSKVYDQIIADLKDARNLLSNEYTFSNNERVRPTKWAAIAMLSRVCLYLRDWTNSEAYATEIIENKQQYDTVSINGIFTKNSKEAIWQLIKDNSNTNDAITFLITGAAPTNAALRKPLVDLFDVADLRRKNWIGTKTTGVNTYYFPSKYKITAISPVQEYSMVLRISEQYLIRAEARNEQGRFVGANSAQTDIDIIRKRAGVNGVTATTKETMALAIEKERILELFTEWGHRWLDLKRTNKADQVLSIIKGANWATTDQLYPIPQNEINNNPALINAQNPGYNN